MGTGFCWNGLAPMEASLRSEGITHLTVETIQVSQMSRILKTKNNQQNDQVQYLFENE